MKYTPNKYTGRSLMHEGGTHKKKKAKTASEEQHEKYLHAEISVRGAKN